MWELAVPIMSCSDHICCKCWLLGELWLGVDELESELQTLRHIWQGVKYLDVLFQEVVTPGRLSTSNSVSDQGQQGVIAGEASRGNLEFRSGGASAPDLVHQENIGPLEDEKGGLIMGNEEIAEALNRHFVLVFTVEDTNNMPVIDDKESKVGKDPETIIIMKEVVLGKLMELKVEKSPGPDGMYPRVLKEMVGEIANVLVIFQNLLDSGAVPADWKRANVTPLFKKGAKVDNFLNIKGIKGYREKVGKWSRGHEKISHGLIEWRSGLEGPDGLLLLLVLKFLCFELCSSVKYL
eukprot:g39958.t1